MPCGVRFQGSAWLFGVFTAVYPDGAAPAPATATALVTAAAVSGLAVAEGPALDGAWGRSRARSRPNIRIRELLRLVADGYTNAQIGRRLGISEGTVRKHLDNTFARLHVSSRAAAVIKAFHDQIA